MTLVLAAIDEDQVMRQVLSAGAALAAVYGAELRAVHVRATAGEACGIGRAIEAPVEVLTGDVVEQLVAAIAGDDVIAAAIGARRDRLDRRPAGSVALEVAQRVDKAVAVVPPDTPILRPGQPLRLLAPLDGTELSSLAVRALLRRVAAADVEVVVLHVFGPATAPPFLDRPEHDLPVWAEEFRARHDVGAAGATEWRRGSPGEAIAEAARAPDIDGVVMGWAQDLREGHAAAVRAVLCRGGVPVVLVPRAQAERTLAELLEPGVDRRRAS
jgi:nucleotide-binding universal stress UspA family protein